MKKQKKAKGLKFIGGGLNFIGDPSKKKKKAKGKDPFSFGKGDGNKSGNAWLRKFSKGAKL